jgi:hypothetical protein
MSRRRVVVELSIAAWNATFGKEKTLRYPSRLEESLRRLRSTVELSLPGLEVRDGDDVSLATRDSLFRTRLTRIGPCTSLIRFRQ